MTGGGVWRGVLGALLTAAIGVRSGVAAEKDGRTTSPHFKDGKFVNSIPESGEQGSMMKMTCEFFFGEYPDREPPGPLPVIALKKDDFTDPVKDGVEFVWLGHSAIVLEIGGKRILFDPILSTRASPVRWAGPKRFQPAAVQIDQLPKIDAVVISHDHYDHLDKKVMKALIPTDARYLVPLGVGKRLEGWKVPATRITEMDWWEASALGGVTLTAVPARHFSGRGMFDRDETFWCSWVISHRERKIYFSGDTGDTPDFEKIGSRFGPMDMSFIKMAAYSHLWPDIHLNPEQAVAAHQKLKGNLLVPIHWATFDLALHSWYEPIERFVQAANAAEVRFITPKMGERVRLGAKRENWYWWRRMIEEGRKGGG